MKKSLAIISGVSLAALIGLGSVVLAGEKDDPKNREDEAQSLNSDSNEVAVESLASKPRDDGDQGKTIGHVDHGKTSKTGVDKDEIKRGMGAAGTQGGGDDDKGGKADEKDDDG